MNPVIHQSELYTGISVDAAEAVRRLLQIEEVIKQSKGHSGRESRATDRNLWTSSLDALLAATRRYVPPLHWLWITVVALGFFFYARLTALTIRLTIVGEQRWPDVPAPCVMAMGTAVRTRGLWPSHAANHDHKWRLWLRVIRAVIV
jgi:hypothetical protein